MRAFQLKKGPEEKLTILCLGAHSDDIEIGCGGTILRLAGEHRNLEVVWVVFCAEGQREEEARRSADLFLRGVASKRVILHAYRDGFLPFVGAEVKDRFEQLKSVVAPDIVFTHYRDDRHQDHRLLSDLAWNTFRDHLILEYEIPKFDGDFGTPNFFVALDERVIEEKIKLVLSTFASQKSKHWFTGDTFSAIARLRGIESGGQTRFAEAFYSRKLVF